MLEGRIYQNAYVTRDIDQTIKLPRFHHSCARVDDWEDFRKRVAKAPYPVVMEGASEGLHFLFLDTRALLGHYMEYTWMSDTAWQRIGGR